MIRLPVCSMNRTLDEWIARYNKKIPEGFKRDEKFTLFYIPDKGFCEMTATDKMIVIGQASGDGVFWRDFAEKIARKLGLKTGGFFCRRERVLLWARLLGFTVTEADEENGLKRYRGTDKNGRWAVMTECVLDNGCHAYLTTWGIKADED